MKASDEMEYCLQLKCKHYICMGCSLLLLNNNNKYAKLECPLCRKYFEITSYLKLVKMIRIKLRKKLTEMRKTR